MKEFFEKYKKAVLIGGCALLVLIAAITAGAVFTVSNNKQNETKVSATAKRDVNEISKKEDKSKKKSSDKKKTDNDVEDVSQSASEVTEEAEIIEDSELDIVEPTPAPSTTAAATSAPTATPTPEVNLTDRAQNAQFPFEIKVNKQMNCITVYAMDNNGVYSIPYKAMVCSTGNATPLGVYTTPAKYIWKVLKGNVWGQYSTRITGSILFHSVPYRSSNKDALISKYYNKLGTTASAGCVRLTTIDAKWIYDNCPIGTRVIIYNDSNPGPLGKPTAMKVPDNNKWDPTDPDPANPWRNKILHIDGVVSKTVEKGASLDIMSGVTAVDGSGNNITGNIKASTNLDTSKTGVYTASYTVSDSTGTTISKDCSITVVDTKTPVISGIKGNITGLKKNEVNRNNLLKGISVTDNGYGMGLEKVEVLIPNLVEGNNTVTYIARDDAGNSTTMTANLIVDMTAPKVTRAASAKSYVAPDYQLTDENIKARIKVTDNTATNIAYNVRNLKWGYAIDYVVTDEGGNKTTFTDSFNYVDYTFVGSKTAVMPANQDLKAGMQLKDSNGKTIALPADVVIMSWKNGENEYEVEYVYKYTTPLGTHECSFTRILYAN